MRDEDCVLQEEEGVVGFSACFVVLSMSLIYILDMLLYFRF